VSPAARRQETPKKPTVPATAEQAMLRHSLWMTLVLAAVGIGFGLISGSLAIVFDGVSSTIDAAMTFISLTVARLVLSEGSRRFQFGYWHLEPMTLALNGGLLVVFCLYGFVTALGDLFTGGRELDFGWALGYAALAAGASLGMVIYEWHGNRRVGSDLVRLDSMSWLMSTVISTTLLVAFAIAMALGDTDHAWAARYADPMVLAVLSAGLALMPIAMLREAWRDIFQIAPTPLDDRVKRVMDDFVARHGFATYASYVARVGRAQFIEVHVVLPADYPVQHIAALDALRAEIALALGAARPERWLTVAFTGDVDAI
jgi:predicted Co/Zn/Cd cation transporter (cation efflux family)